jgi:hypothetical protein
MFEADQAGTPLQPFCLLAKSAKGAACVSLIKQALDHPSIFVFGELIDMPSIKEARASLGRCVNPCDMPAPSALRNYHGSA